MRLNPFKKESALYNEQEIGAYCSRLVSELDKAAKRSLEEQKILSEITAQTDELSKIYKTGMFGRFLSMNKNSVRRIEAFKKIDQIKLKLVSLIRTQENMISAGLNGSERMLNQISNLHLVHQSADAYEKSLLNELILHQKQAVSGIIQIMEKCLASLREQEQIVEKFKLSDISKSDLELSEMQFQAELKRHIEWVIEAVYTIKGAANSLVKESKNIIYGIRQEKKAKTIFTKEDLDELRKLAEFEVKEGESRIASYRRILKDQKQLRLPIETKRLIAVHLTDTFPDKGIIKTKGQYTFELYGVEINYPRESIHFTFNGPVEQHAIGPNWELKRLAILIPAEKIIDRFVHIAPEDSIILGQLELPEGSEIIGRAKDVQGRDAGRATIIPIFDFAPRWKKRFIHEQVAERIRNKGYSPMKVGDWSWLRAYSKHDFEVLKNFIESLSNIQENQWSVYFRTYAEELGKIYGGHNGSFWMNLEKFVEYCYSKMSESNTSLSPGEILEMRERVVKYAAEIKEKSKEFLFPEEKEACLRIKDALKKLYRDLKQKYPTTWKNRAEYRSKAQKYRRQAKELEEYSKKQKILQKAS
jgi:hypothetical protein